MEIESITTGKRSAKLPPRLVIGLFLAIVIDTFLQVFWKMAALELPDNLFADPVADVMIILREPLLLFVLVLFVAQMVNWLVVLSDADVSFALPITALSYVTVAAASALWLGEQLNLNRLLGMALILAGVFLISRTDHDTLKPLGPL